MNRIKLFLAVFIFGLILVPNAFNSGSASAVAPYPTGNADSPQCAYNRNTLRYEASPTSWPHRTDANYDWFHCGITHTNATSSSAKVWMPDNAQSLTLFQVIANNYAGRPQQASGNVIVADAITGQIYYSSSFASLPGTLLSSGGGQIKNPNVNISIPNLGQKILSIQTSGSVTRAHFNVRKNNTPRPGTFTASATTACNGTTPRNTVNWTTSSNATSYEIYLGSTRVGGPVSSSTRSFVHSSGLTNSMSYTYTVRAINSTGTTSASASTITTQNCNPPAPVTPPTISSATATCSGADLNVKVDWSNAGSGTYKVYQGNNLLATLTNTYTYSYKLQNSITAQNLVHRIEFTPSGSTTSVTSATRTTAAPACIPLPGAFTLTATAACSSDNKPIVNLSWGASSNANSGYAVVKEISGSSQIISSKNSAQFTHTDTGLDSGVAVTYLVKAVNGTGATDSNRVPVTTRNDCQAPLEAEVTLEVEKDVYQQGEQVRFTFTNNGPDSVQLRNLAPFDIGNSSAKVFTPNAAQVVKTLIAGNNDSWTWNQLNNSNAQVPIGDYIVTVYYFLDGEQKSVTDTFTVVAKPADPEPDEGIDLSVVPQKGYAPLDVTATSLVDGDRYDWDFGDGTIIENGQKSESHIYTTPGTYTVTLTIGDKSASKIVVVDTPITPSIGFDFSVTPSYGPAPLNVIGTILSECDDDITWDWGDGTVDTNSTAVKAHTYTSAGSYTVKASCGSDSGTKIVTVTAPTTGTPDPTDPITPPVTSPGFSFTVTPDSGTPPLTVTGTITSECDDDITWDWGDGTVDTNSTTTKTHTYSAVGTYTVTASCGDQSGTHIVRVLEAALPDTGNPFFNFLRPIWDLVGKVF